MFYLAAKGAGNVRKIIASNMITLDGFFAGPNGEIDWFFGGEDFYAGAPAELNAVDTILMGRVNYEGMLSYWTSPAALEGNPVVAERMNSPEKIVFSRTLDKVEWGKWDNARLVKGDIGEEVRKLKQQPGGNMLMFGSGSITSQLADLGLIDLYIFFVNPVVIGSGKTLFATLTKPIKFNLVATKVFNSGVVRHVCTPA